MITSWNGAGEAECARGQFWKEERMRGRVVDGASVNVFLLVLNDLNVKSIFLPDRHFPISAQW